MRRYRVTYEIEAEHTPPSTWAVSGGHLTTPKPQQAVFFYPRYATVEDITPWVPEAGQNAKCVTPGIAQSSDCFVIAIDGTEAWVKWGSGNRGIVGVKYLQKP